MHLRIKKLLLGAFSLSLCLLFSFGKASQVSAASNINPYTGKIFNHDTRFKNYTIYNGIDVSKFQGAIDWKKVKAAGIDYAFIRCGYSGMANGGHATDPNYATNINNAYNAGIKIGIYYFSQALTTAEAKSEANYALNLIKPYKAKITLPVVFDFEFGTYTLNNKSYPARANTLEGKPATVTNNAIAFMSVFENAGFDSMYYGNKSTLKGSFDTSKLKNYACWLASYPASSTTIFTNGYTGDYMFWQYSDSGRVNGITGNVDMDFYYAQSATKNYITTGTSSVSTSSGTSQTSVSVSKVSGFKQLRNTSTTITLSWTKNTSADGYEIYRSTSPNGTFSKVKTITSNSTVSWQNTARSKNRQYYYKIRAYKEVNNKTYYSSYSSVIAGHTNAYIGVYRKTITPLNVRSYPGTAYASVAVLPANTKVQLIYSTSASNGVTWYKISWSGKTGYVCGAYLKTLTSVSVSKVSGFKQLRNTATTITLSWTKNTSATGYEIYRSASPNGTFSKVKTITSNSTVSWQNTARSKNRQYYYKIRAYKKVNGKIYYSSYSSVIAGHTNAYIGVYRKTKTPLNVRSYPGTAYASVAVLSANKKVQVLYSTRASNGVTWYKISWSGKTGYVCGAYLKKA